MATGPRIFTIPASVPFLPALIGALVDGRLVEGFRPAANDPLALATATLYLPTRRACRLARDVFLDVLGTNAAILPRIVPIGDLDEDELVFAEAAAGAALDLPDALGGFERNALLAELILKWVATPGMRAEAGAPLVAQSPAAAMALAADLARLIDDMTTRQVPWSRLDELVPDALDPYWQKTLQFLKIAREWWPQELAARGRIEPAARRDRLIAAEAARLAAHDGPVIAAGSTGSMPATAALLTTIAGLPHGAVVLPGLDTELDAPSWEAIGATSDSSEPAHGHPQYAMQALLRRMGLPREAVDVVAPPRPHGRERLVSEALRPADKTAAWQQRLADPVFTGHAAEALASVTVIEAAGAEDEALAIAVALREAVETPGKTAALVTPDRALARRVLAALARWDVAADDSGGDALSDTAAGVFARLVAEAALGGLAPVTLLALLKHPLARVDLGAVHTLERAILRGPRPRPGTAGLLHALATFRGMRIELRASDPRAGIGNAALAEAEALAAQLQTALSPLEALKGPQRFSEIAKRHQEVVQALGHEPPELAKLFEEIIEHGHLTVRPAEYAELFRTTMDGIVVRRPEADVRVRIFGPLEARLQNVDRLVLGGLVEGVWPPQAPADPWLSRPMRHQLGLDLPERRIGLSAHDFAQALGAPEVILTRAAKLGGAPTVASRFVQRLAAMAGEARWREAIRRGEQYLAWARTLDEPAAPARPAPRPTPRPPLAARPKQLSVTEIEHWLRDPYTIYAKHVLRLVPLDAVDTPPGAADRGTVIHNAIGDFTKAFAQQLPDDVTRELENFGAAEFAKLADYPEARAFWWPRFQRIARWFAGFEGKRRAGLIEMQAETAGKMVLQVEPPFTLSVRADRIERLRDGSYAILDYKTGRPPTEKQVRTGLSPQLTLEAAILRSGGFPNIPAGATVSEVVYVRVNGGEPAGKDEAIVFKEGTPDSQADRALERLTRVAAAFTQEETAYVSLVHPMWTTHYGDYDHLARVKEWSLNTGEENGLDA